MAINCYQLITLDTEIRKLQAAQVYKLCILLNASDSWKKLMAIVPNGSGKYKFNSDHFNLIEQASHQQKRGCAEIFLDEWSTMGKNRPTLKSLLDLLTEAELYRVADYIAVDVLNWKEGPKRPNSGPAAQIDLSALLLENSDGNVESSSSISGDVYEEYSFANKMGNSEEDINECVSKRKEINQIPAFLNDVTFSLFNTLVNEESLQKINTISSESDNSKTTNESNLKNVKSDNEKPSVRIPRCVLEMSLSSSGVQKADESLQTTSGHEPSNILIPRMVLDFTGSQ